MLKLKCDGTQVGALFAPANGGRVSGVAAARVLANCGVNTVQFTAALQSNLEQDKAVKVALAHAMACNAMSHQRVTVLQVAQFFGSHGVSL